MQGWKSPKDKKKELGDCTLQGKWLDHVGLCDLIASASDRSTIGRLDPKYSAVTYQQETGLQIRHLLSGEPQTLQVNSEWKQELSTQRRAFLANKESEFLRQISQWEDPQKVFWALWRCYLEVLEKEESSVHILPAETRLPDGSLWSHVSMTSALSGGLAGYYKNSENYPQKNKSFDAYSRPYLVNFTFSPIQELIKASRKIRDFWAGSWILHYLSAKICWKIANKYGADSLLYPCLYQQPLIDQWLLDQYSDFNTWITKPKTDKLLTAGFPNVIIMILPNNGKSQDEQKDNPIYAATQLAKQTLLSEWKALGTKSLEFLQNNPHWDNLNLHTWDDWLQGQWQTYWTAFPIGDPDSDLTCSLRLKKDQTREEKEQELEQWCQKQNDLTEPQKSLFETNENQFLKEIFRLTDSESDEKSSPTKYRGQPNLNVGSWWAYIFNQLRLSLNSIKNARSWEISTAFAVRSSLSGIGSAVHPIVNKHNPDWIAEGDVNQFWAERLGLFNGSEKLNATEVVKRVLHYLLPELLDCSKDDIALSYPDLTAGVAGYLKQASPDEIEHYHHSCQKIYRKILDDYSLVTGELTQAWGIPWVDSRKSSKFSDKSYHPRFLNAGWLVEDLKINQEEIKDYKQDLQKAIEQQYPNNNPTDWYILSVGDGDGLGNWLKSSKLKPYGEYLPDELKQKILTEGKIDSKYQQPLQKFLQVTKRMGPATHSALTLFCHFPKIKVK